MSRPTILAKNTPLTDKSAEPGCFSLLSLNVLLPNSADGWWISKYYQPSTPPQQRAWPHRQALLERLLTDPGADLVCIQEASAESFEDDFAFMKEAGYDCVLHRKFRFRAATFWRRDKIDLVEARHKNKTLVTTLRFLDQPEQPPLHLVNVHLTGGPNPDKRFRELFEALDQVRKEAVRAKQTPEQAAVIVCGDFNSFPGGCATDRLIFNGVVEPDFREADHPDKPITSKLRGHRFAPMADPYLDAYGSEADRPATLIVPSLIERFRSPSGLPTEAFEAGIRAMFDRFSDGRAMTPSDAEAWLRTINGQPDRGSEHRKALAAFEASEGGNMDFEAFLALYLSEIAEGKLWGVHHDMTVCGAGLDPVSEGPYEASLDRIFHSDGPLEAVAVRASLSDEQHKKIYVEGDVLPNAWHPSDHLPLAAVFRWRRA